MNLKTLPLCVLLLTASLASCAPAVQGPNGQALRSVRGADVSAVQTVPIDQLTASTPETSFVTFPDCVGAAVLVPDVRQLGTEAADAACRRVAAPPTFGLGQVVLVGAGSATLGIGLFIFLVRLYVSSIP